MQRRGGGRGLGAVLFTDIVGSTAIAAQMGNARWGELVARHHRLIRRELRRYGVHGINVEWCTRQVRARRLVVCHLGSGCSVTAVHDGRSVDTTMGWTPLEGVRTVRR